ncbi:MAG: glycosyltransferase [Blautia sp.]|nr:glycosyltransferase [Blautia sp.]MCM1202169.1 glycosyltransferase [Bacteroides fragilis]
MRITIITVCFNSEKTIERTIQSVLAQTCQNVEYLLIDGMSTDGTLEIIQKYETAFRDKGYAYKWISEKDRGIYDAMNKGLKYAAGDFIGILNSDDWYEEGALESIEQAVENSRKKGKEPADIYMGSIRIHNGGQLIIKRGRDRKYKTTRNFNHPAMFVKRECYKAVGGYGIHNIHDDYGWYLRAVKMDMTVEIIDKVLTNYPTGGAGSPKSIGKTIKRIGAKYRVYRENGYSRLYFLECAGQELMKYALLRR